jgi:hypothetical protein
MSTLDPRKHCTVHDRLNDCPFEWKPEWADNYRKHAELYEASRPASSRGTGCCLMGGSSPKKKSQSSGESRTINLRCYVDRIHFPHLQRHLILFVESRLQACAA